MALHFERRDHRGIPQARWTCDCGAAGRWLPHDADRIDALGHWRVNHMGDPEWRYGKEPD